MSLRSVFQCALCSLLKVELKFDSLAPPPLSCACSFSPCVCLCVSYIAFLWSISIVTPPCFHKLVLSLSVGSSDPPLAKHTRPCDGCSEIILTQTIPRALVCLAGWLLGWGTCSVPWGRWARWPHTTHSVTNKTIRLVANNGTRLCVCRYVCCSFWFDVVLWLI